MRILYATAGCPLGRLLVAATERGICAVYLGDSDAELEAALHGEFPSAEIQRGESRLGDAIRVIVSHISGQQPSLDLPLDVRATAFQRRVWQELQRIPYGSTRTYAEIARALGRPKAARAVGRACAANPVSILVPCHRVLRTDGSLGGYRWGLARKKALLAGEAPAQPTASGTTPSLNVYPKPRTERM